MTDFSYSRNVKCPGCGTWFNTAEGMLCDCLDKRNEDENEDNDE